VSHGVSGAEIYSNPGPKDTSPCGQCRVRSVGAVGAAHRP